MLKRILTITVCILVGYNLSAQTNVPDTFKPRLRLNLPLIDANHWQNAAFTSANFNKPNSDGKPNFGDWAFSMLKNPSMYQATELNQDAVKTLAWGSQTLTNKLIKPTTFFRKTVNVLTSQLLSGSSVFVLGGFPLGGGWLHEEYHRAMLATNRVASKDPFDDFSVDLSDGSVKNIYDDALKNFKKNDPYVFNRMLIAGSEGELMAVRRFQENNFFYDENLPTELTSIIYTANAVSYLNSSYESIDSTNIALNRKDGTNMLARDFTGHDFSGWIWHLFNPYVPYDSLGTHPSGVGINRYITSDRLTDKEKKYYDDIKKNAWLNYLSPMIFGFRKIKLKDSVFVNFAIQYQATSFGTVKELRLYFMNSKNKYCFALHNFRNYNNNFYAAEFNWVDFKFKKLKNISFASRLIVGNQPKNQEFFTKKSQLLGLVSINTNYTINKNIRAYFQVQVKTEGWVAGDEYLKSMVRLRTGLSAYF